jgi:hypothetical protein
LKTIVVVFITSEIREIGQFPAYEETFITRPNQICYLTKRLDFSLEKSGRGKKHTANLHYL